MTQHKTHIHAIAAQLSLLFTLALLGFATIGSTIPSQSIPTATPLSANEESTLFPDQITAKLFWLEKDRSFVVGLGQPLSSEYRLDYQSVDYSSGILSITNYPLNNVQIAESIVRELNLTDKFDTPYDETHFALAPDHQHAVYYLNSRLFVYNVEQRTSYEVASRFPIGEVNQVVWLHDNTVLLVVKPPYGAGNILVKICLDSDCFIQFDSYIPDIIGIPSVSEDHHFALATSLTSPNTLYRIDLSEQGVYQMLHLDSIPFVRGDVAPVWANHENAAFLIGSETDGSGAIYKVTFGDNTHIEEAKIVNLGDELAYSTALWLVDEEHQLSVHALLNGGLRIFRWRP